MPRVILLQAFVLHYAGTVFDLPDETDVADWPEEEWMREKQNYSGKRVYTLADAGNGRPETLPLSDAVLCPEAVFEGTDLTTGPCRITSVSNGLEDGKLDQLGTEGRGKIRLNDERKNEIRIFLETDVTPRTIVRPSGQTESKVVWNDVMQLLDFSACLPGFYQVNVQERAGIEHSFTVMKCFPLVVEFDQRTQRYITKKTIW